MSAVQVSRDGPVATVTLCRPEVRNAFNEEVIALLAQAFMALRDQEGLRVVVLQGEGPTFCAGADLEWMRRAASWSEEENRRDALALASMLRLVATFPRPVVARVQGGAYGGGVGLIAAVDLAIAAEDAQFAFTEVRLGLAPATISPYVIEKIGPAWARRLFLTGEPISARRAYELGLLYRIVPPAELDAAVAETVRAILQGGPQAQAACKELVARVAADPSPQVDEYTSRLIAQLRAGEEGREGVQAFLEKRAPRWRHV
jgi:methylglutaconyl-CoA hydratase